MRAILVICCLFCSTVVYSITYTLAVKQLNGAPCPDNTDYPCEYVKYKYIVTQNASSMTIDHATCYKRYQKNNTTFPEQCFRFSRVLDSTTNSNIVKRMKVSCFEYQNENYTWLVENLGMLLSEVGAIAVESLYAKYYSRTETFCSSRYNNLSVLSLKNRNVNLRNKFYEDVRILLSTNPNKSLLKKEDIEVNGP